MVTWKPFPICSSSTFHQAGWNSCEQNYSKSLRKRSHQKMAMALLFYNCEGEPKEHKKWTIIVKSLDNKKTKYSQKVYKNGQECKKLHQRCTNYSQKGKIEALKTSHKVNKRCKKKCTDVLKIWTKSAQYWRRKKNQKKLHKNAKKNKKKKLHLFHQSLSKSSLLSL